MVLALLFAEGRPRGCGRQPTDAVVICTHAPGWPTAQMRKWTQTWSPRRLKACASLVVLPLIFHRLQTGLGRSLHLPAAPVASIPSSEVGALGTTASGHPSGSSVQLGPPLLDAALPGVGATSADLWRMGLAVWPLRVFLAHLGEQRKVPLVLMPPLGGFGLRLEALLSPADHRLIADEDDVHRCGRCQTEFTALEDFVQHKLQKVCQRAPQEALPATPATAALLGREVSCLCCHHTPGTDCSWLPVTQGLQRVASSCG